MALSWNTLASALEGYKGTQDWRLQQQQEQERLRQMQTLNANLPARLQAENEGLRLGNERTRYETQHFVEMMAPTLQIAQGNAMRIMADAEKAVATNPGDIALTNAMNAAKTTQADLDNIMAKARSRPENVSAELLKETVTRWNDTWTALSNMLKAQSSGLQTQAFIEGGGPQAAAETDIKGAQALGGLADKTILKTGAEINYLKTPRPELGGRTPLEVFPELAGRAERLEKEASASESETKIKYGEQEAKGRVSEIENRGAYYKAGATAKSPEAAAAEADAKQATQDDKDAYTAYKDTRTAYERALKLNATTPTPETAAFLKKTLGDMAEAEAAYNLTRFRPLLLKYKDKLPMSRYVVWEGLQKGMMAGKTPEKALQDFLSGTGDAASAEPELENTRPELRDALSSQPKWLQDNVDYFNRKLHRDPERDEMSIVKKGKAAIDAHYEKVHKRYLSRREESEYKRDIRTGIKEKPTAIPYAPRPGF